MKTLRLLYLFVWAVTAMIAEESREARLRKKLGADYEGPLEGYPS